MLLCSTVHAHCASLSFQKRRWKCQNCNEFSSWYPDETKRHYERCIAPNSSTSSSAEYPKLLFTKYSRKKNSCQTVELRYFLFVDFIESSVILRLRDFKIDFFSKMFLKSHTWIQTNNDYRKNSTVCKVKFQA